MLVLPGAANDFTLEEFEQEMRAAAGTVLLLERGHIARAHCAGIGFAASTEADAAKRRFRERTIIVGELKICAELERLVVRAEAQVFRGQVRIDDFVRVELVFRIPGGFEFAERSNQLGAKHFWEKRGTRLAVAMLAGKRTAVAEVAVVRAAIVELVHQLAKIAQISPEFFRRDSGIVPAFPLWRSTRCERR